MEEQATDNTEEKKPVITTDDDYEETDVFQWANNLVQYVDELKIQLYFFGKSSIPFRVKLSGDVSRQLRPLFIDEVLEYILGGIDKGLIVRTFEEAEKEDNVLQKTKIKNVDKLVEVLSWVKHQQTAIEDFNESEHDLKHMKAVIAMCSHTELKEPFFLIKSLPTSQVMKGHTAWLLKDNVFKPFDTFAALKIPADNQLLAVGQDLFVFNQAKLKSIFGYDAKAASIAEQKVAEIEANYKLSMAEGVTIQDLIKNRPATIKKLQKVEPGVVKQEEMISHADEIGVGLMVDDNGAIILIDHKDMTRFVNLLNDDYIESPMTGQRYEIVKKRVLKDQEEEQNLLKDQI